MLASPESVLSQQPQRKSSQPLLSMEDGQNTLLRNSHISPGGLVNSNPSSNDVMDEVRTLLVFLLELGIWGLVN